MGRFSPERITWTNSFPFKQKARYLPSGEITAESNGLSHAYVVSGLRDISFVFPAGLSGCCRTLQRARIL